MSDTLYLQLDTNIQVQHPHIYLQDIAKLACSNAKVLNRLRVLPYLQQKLCIRHCISLVQNLFRLPCYFFRSCFFHHDL